MKRKRALSTLISKNCSLRRKKPEDARIWAKLYSGLHHAMLSSVQLGAVVEDKQFTLPTRIKPDSKDPRVEI
jgi:hypothetical protein